jgi:hypothetical protein
MKEIRKVSATAHECRNTIATTEEEMFSLATASPKVVKLPPGESDAIAWAEADKNGWIHDYNVPLTQVRLLQQVALVPPCDPKGTAHVFPRMVEAFPLTVNGPPGSAPNGKATWWTQYFNTKTLAHSKRAWVQGHLLNHHIHGVGEPANLVPITDQLNRIMEKWAESVVKNEILKKGKILRYRVTVNWSAGARSGSGHDWMGSATRHPAAMHQAFGDGIKDGECLAPTSLEWLASYIHWDGTKWVEDGPVNFKGYTGHENAIFYNNWNQL